MFYDILRTSTTRQIPCVVKYDVYTSTVNVDVLPDGTHRSALLEINFGNVKQYDRRSSFLDLQLLNVNFLHSSGPVRHTVDFV